MEPADLIDLALTEIANRVRLVEGDSPDSHTVVETSGLDDPAVVDALGLYAVACLAGWVKRDARIGGHLGVKGIEARSEVRRLVGRIVDPDAKLNGAALESWMLTWRNAWLAEVATHALLVTRQRAESACVHGPVLAVMRPHPLPKRQGLDSVAIYNDKNTPVIAIGETKATRRRGSEELTNACNIYDDIDSGAYGPDIRNVLDLLADVLPNDLRAQISDSIWREHRCYLPAILHEEPFDVSAKRARLARLAPRVDRKRVLVLRVADFDAFFDSVAESMRRAVDVLVV